MVLIHNGAHTPKHSLHRKTNIIQNMTQHITCWLLLSLDRRAVVKKRSFYGTFVELNKFRFLTHAFQDPPLWSSTELMYAYVEVARYLLICHACFRYTSDRMYSYVRSIESFHKNNKKRTVHGFSSNRVKQAWKHEHVAATLQYLQLVILLWRGFI